MTRDYPIKTAARSGVLTVTEHPDRIELALTFSRYGDLGDGADILRQLAPHVRRYDADPRPLVVDSPDFGRRAVVFDAPEGTYMFAAEETRQ